ncbi:MAG: ORF6N domain-containing protein [Rhodobacter sp.]|nr:ORF6N domain-containing protein [Rhodobacter sp.]MCA3461899.1 ORF6N domain-containing protein [Rhodobacter sp.]MCA3464495.1 ORF6N domain-containing protein [Rhodobacter sp.]MCA3467475.1 ORF6N domain-containing protein [Rhodobacter sp.]MCA3482807.1 ORF6N domain-containing protein [Rhodobacter sp.]
MSLPTIAGVQSRITNLPSRPPFMLAEAVAEVFGTTASNLMRQVRRNMDLFPDDFLIKLTEEEYREKSCQIGTTSQGKRGDLTHYGFTEAGALMVPQVLRTVEARAASLIVVRAFLSLRDGTMNRLRIAAFKDEVAYIGRSKMRLAIKLAAAEGWSFGKLWDEHDWSAPRLGREVEEMRIRGYIPQNALFVPHYVYQRRKAEAALMEIHAEDARQMDLFQKKVH